MAVDVSIVLEIFAVVELVQEDRTVGAKHLGEVFVCFIEGNNLSRLLVPFIDHLDAANNLTIAEHRVNLLISCVPELCLYAPLRATRPML